MAIGKQSLERVANGGAEAVVAPEQPVPAVKPKKTEAKKPAEGKKTVIAKPANVVATTNKAYAIGEKLPEYLL